MHFTANIICRGYLAQGKAGVSLPALVHLALPLLAHLHHQLPAVHHRRASLLT